VPIAESLRRLQLDDGTEQEADVLPHLKPLCSAIDMVFGSAAALSATFGFKACTRRSRLDRADTSLLAGISFCSRCGPSARSSPHFLYACSCMLMP
jgi:hypothetical protein